MPHARTQTTRRSRVNLGRAHATPSRETQGRGGRQAVSRDPRYRRPKDRRSRPDQWADAISTLTDCLDRYQEWRDNLPANLADSALAERLDAVQELRDLVDQLSIADLPRRERGGTEAEPRCPTQNASLQIEPAHPLILESRHAWSISIVQRFAYYFISVARGRLGIAGR